MNNNTNYSTSKITFAPEFLEIIRKYQQQEQKTNNIIFDNNDTNINNTNTITSLSLSTIDISSLSSTSSDNSNNNTLSILPSVNPNEKTNVSENHDAQPIKSSKHISAIINYYLLNKQYRNAMLFIVGINVGLRVSDLREIRFKDLITDNMTFKEYFNVSEKKTRNTRGKKKNMINLNKLSDMTQEEMIQYVLDKADEEIDKPKAKSISKPRTIYINEAVRKIITLYLRQASQNGNPKTLDDYLFVAEQSNNKKMLQLSYKDENGDTIYLDKYIQAPMTDSAIYPILINTTSKLGITGRYSTHAYRKTFAYHILMQIPNVETNNKPNERQLEFLQKVLGHSQSSTTLHYAGLTEDEIKAAYKNLNLGLDDINKYLSNQNYN